MLTKRRQAIATESKTGTYPEEMLIKSSFPRKWACTREDESSALIILDSRLRGSDENAQARVAELVDALPPTRE